MGRRARKLLVYPRCPSLVKVWAGQFRSEKCRQRYTLHFASTGLWSRRLRQLRRLQAQYLREKLTHRAAVAFAFRIASHLRSVRRWVRCFYPWPGLRISPVSIFRLIWKLSHFQLWSALSPKAFLERLVDAADEAWCSRHLHSWWYMWCLWSSLAHW